MFPNNKTSQLKWSEERTDGNKARGAEWEQTFEETFEDLDTWCDEVIDGFQIKHISAEFNVCGRN